MADQSEVVTVVNMLNELWALGDKRGEALEVTAVAGGRSTLKGKAGWDADRRCWEIVLDTAVPFELLAHSAFHELGHIELGHIRKIKTPDTMAADVALMRGENQARAKHWAEVSGCQGYTDNEEAAEAYAREMMREFWPQIQREVRAGRSRPLAAKTAAWANKRYPEIVWGC